MKKEKVELTAEEKQKVRKQNMFTIIGLVVCIIIIAAICIPIFTSVYSCADACGSHRAGDFTYKYDYFGSSSEKTVVITGLTKQGKQKEVLIIPESIKGYEVSGIQQPTILDAPAYIESENLTTIYLHKNIAYDVTIKCPKLEKVFVIKANEHIYFGNSAGPIEDMCFIYSKVHFNRVGHYSMPPYPANVTYYYNYDGADNDGCYWLDNLEDGEKITYIPSDPTREGYKFEGWYHEPECITQWDFETDTVKSSGEDGYTNRNKFIENKLYAKWTKI